MSDQDEADWQRRVNVVTTAMIRDGVAPPEWSPPVLVDDYFDAFVVEARAEGDPELIAELEALRRTGPRLAPGWGQKGGWIAEKLVDLTQDFTVALAVERFVDWQRGRRESAGRVVAAHGPLTQDEAQAFAGMYLDVSAEHPAPVDDLICVVAEQRPVNELNEHAQWVACTHWMFVFRGPDARYEVALRETPGFDIPTLLRFSEQPSPPSRFDRLRRRVLRRSSGQPSS